MLHRSNGFIVLVALLICSGCGDRDTSTPRAAIIGHWRVTAPDGSYHFDFFIRPDGTIIFSESVKPGIYLDLKYKVGKQNTNFNTIEISMIQKDDGTWEEPKTYSLSQDFTEMDDGGIIFQYVDSKLEP